MADHDGLLPGLGTSNWAISSYLKDPTVTLTNVQGVFCASRRQVKYTNTWLTARELAGCLSGSNQVTTTGATGSALMDSSPTYYSSRQIQFRSKESFKEKCYQTIPNAERWLWDSTGSCPLQQPSSKNNRKHSKTLSLWTQQGGCSKGLPYWLRQGLCRVHKVTDKSQLDFGSQDTT